MSDAAGTTDNPIVVCDANIFYSIVTTDPVLSLGVAELFRLRWTNQIHDEWMRTLLANRPDLDPAKIERQRKHMDEAIDDCLVEGYEYLIPELDLPLTYERTVEVELASGTVVDEDVYSGTSRFDGREQTAAMIITDSEDTLIGTGLLTAKVLLMNFVTRKAIIKDHVT
jgi:hypothetical protein